MNTTCTYFAKDAVQYGNLNENNTINTETFLRGCQGIVDFVEFLGVAYAPVRHDIAGNVAKVRSKFDEDPAKFALLNALVDADLTENSGRLGVATEGLLWLKRGLEFMLHFLELLVKDHESGKCSESMAGFIKQAYEHSLKRHHAFFQRQLFKMLSHVAPYRRTLLEAVAGGDGVEVDRVVKDMHLYVVNFRANVDALVTMYEQKKLEKPPPAIECPTAQAAAS